MNQYQLTLDSTSLQRLFGENEPLRQLLEAVVNQVLEAQVAEGLRNVDIADRLSTSRKIVEHHVSGVLMKFNARSRAEAVQRAYELGLLPLVASDPAPK